MNVVIPIGLLMLFGIVGLIAYAVSTYNTLTRLSGF